jgi:hypothetical protein
MQRVDGTKRRRRQLGRAIEDRIADCDQADRSHHTPRSLGGLGIEPGPGDRRHLASQVRRSR